MDRHGYSSTVLDKIVTAGSELKSFQRAGKMLGKLAELEISAMQVARLTHEIGAELVVERDRAADQHRYRQLVPDAQQPPVDLACVEVDGGRIMTRAVATRGVHDRQWKETKVGCLWRMVGPTHATDPHPELPRSLASPQRVPQLVRELKGCTGGPGKPAKSPGTEPAEARAAEAAEPAPAPAPAEVRPRWQPERIFRTCVATLRDVHEFGPLVAAEAQRRGFYAARRRAFLGDGSACNWTMHRLHFRSFTAIVDFMHVVGYVYGAAGAVTNSWAAQWEQYLTWATACWQGRVDAVLVEMREWSTRLGAMPCDAADDDPRKLLASAITYLEHNRERMNYAEYRRQGLPVTSSLVESLIKEFNLRVKGTEKFWNRPDQVESILQVRAALLSDDDRLNKHLRNRPGSPYTRPQRHRQACCAP